MLHKYGAPRWIARIMLTWGIVTILLAFTKNATMFYVLRFLLGASEAGLYPGRDLLPDAVVSAAASRAHARLFHARQQHRQHGRRADLRLSARQGLAFDLQGWQLVFIVTGLPSVLLTAVVLLWLPASPLKATFLSDHEKKWLADTLETERAQAAQVGDGRLESAERAHRAARDRHGALLHDAVDVGLRRELLAADAGQGLRRHATRSTAC